MTDNEIIKILEYCATDGWCSNCPHEKKCIEDEITQLALDLINRQKADIERLEDLNKCYYTSCQQIAKSNHEIKAEAVKEFIKRFEKKIKDVKFTIGQSWEIKSALKEVVKEMVGEG